jgi:hypothetical protein
MWTSVGLQWGIPRNLDDVPDRAGLELDDSRGVRGTELEVLEPKDCVVCELVPSPVSAPLSGWTVAASAGMRRPPLVAVVDWVNGSVRDAAPTRGSSLVYRASFAWAPVSGAKERAPLTCPTPSKVLGRMWDDGSLGSAASAYPCTVEASRD